MSSESPALASESPVSADRSYFVDPETTFEGVRDLLGRKWHMRIVYYLLDDGPMGFSELKDELSGVSSKMLSESLSSLQERGLVVRDIVSDQPVRVTYSLTEKGAALAPLVDDIIRWDSEYGADGEAGR